MRSEAVSAETPLRIPLALFVQILFWHLTDLRGKWAKEAWLFEVLADGLAGDQEVHRGA